MFRTPIVANRPIDRCINWLHRLTTWRALQFTGSWATRASWTIHAKCSVRKDIRRVTVIPPRLSQIWHTLSALETSQSLSRGSLLEKLRQERRRMYVLIRGSYRRATNEVGTFMHWRNFVINCPGALQLSPACAVDRYGALSHCANSVSLSVVQCIE